jgi:hypothetical protein
MRTTAISPSAMAMVKVRALLLLVCVMRLTSVSSLRAPRHGNHLGCAAVSDAGVWADPERPTGAERIGELRDADCCTKGFCR